VYVPKVSVCRLSL